MIFLRFVKNGSWWYDTVLCYPLGMFWSIYKERINKIMDKAWLWWTCLLTSLILTGAMYFIPLGAISSILLNLFFVCFVMILTMKVAFNNKILYWLGTHLFEIYIFMRLPMILCQEFGVIDFNVYLAFAICAVVTFIIAKFYKMGIDYLWKKIILLFRKKDEEKNGENLSNNGNI